jgi:cell division protein FtsQ
MTGFEPIDEAPRGRGRKFVAALILIVLLAPASWLARRAASKMEFFHVRSVQVDGVRYLEPETVVQTLAIDTLRSVWDDTGPLLDRVLSLPQVSAASIRRKLPGTLVVTISENLPVAFVQGAGGLEAVDTSGRALPIAVAGRDLDLPVLHQRDARLLRLVGHIRAEQGIAYRRLSEASISGKDEAVLLLRARVEPMAPPAAATRSDSLAPNSAALDSTATVADSASLPPPPAEELLRVRVPLGVSVARLADIFPVEFDLRRRAARVSELDLRYRDQVIARLQ